MNQEQNNLNPNNFNTQGNNGIPNNQPLNNQSMSVSQQSINPQPQTPGYQQPISNTFESGNANNQNLNSKPPKKMNLGLIIGIFVAVAVVGVGIVFGSKLLSNSDNNNSDTNTSTIQQNNNLSTNNVVEIVYFDVVTGKKCNESDYNISNSKNGYNGIINRDDDDVVSEKENEQTSCLKFFVLSENDTTKSLLLDHNTTPNTYWNVNDNQNGPGLKSSKELKSISRWYNSYNEVLYSLKEDTNNWAGTENPKNHSYSSHEIDYSDFKARLPQSEEIVEAGDISNWIIENELGYFGGKTATTELSKYWWLYDNLEGCKKYGCKHENKEIKYTDGYWILNSYDINSILEVANSGCVNLRSSVYTNGVRPVIEVLKSKLN